MNFGGDSAVAAVDESESSDSDDLSRSERVTSTTRRFYNSRVNNEPVGGLVGLQNIGNTCYMNSAIQALSNTQPLTSYFLECATATHIASENKKPGLSRTYQQLMKQIWNKKNRGYVIPSGKVLHSRFLFQSIILFFPCRYFVWNKKCLSYVSWIPSTRYTRISSLFYGSIA